MGEFLLSKRVQASQISVSFHNISSSSSSCVVQTLKDGARCSCNRESFLRWKRQEWHHNRPARTILKQSILIKGAIFCYLKPCTCFSFLFLKRLVHFIRRLSWLMMTDDYISCLNTMETIALTTVTVLGVSLGRLVAVIENGPLQQRQDENCNLHVSSLHIYINQWAQLHSLPRYLHLFIHNH